MRFKQLLLPTACLLLVGCIRADDSCGEIIIGRGTCDASAVVALDAGFFAVADDEDNILRVYSPAGGAPVHTADLSHFLRVDPDSPEVDLEAAAPLGDRVYWISSHAVNKNGKDRPSRRRFFATRFDHSNGRITIKPLGRPCLNLLDYLIAEPSLREFDLARASRRAPKTEDALNIEGLCATPEGSLLIGFRNPIPGGRALIVPLLNPSELIENGRARFGKPQLIDLDGLGIRSLALAKDGYRIIAGSYDGEGSSFLYHWNGGTDAPRRLDRTELSSLNPEAIDFFRQGGTEQLLVVSDDGTMQIGGEDCKNLEDPALKYFRATLIDP